MWPPFGIRLALILPPLLHRLQRHGWPSMTCRKAGSCMEGKLHSSILSRCTYHLANCASAPGFMDSPFKVCVGQCGCDARATSYLPTGLPGVHACLLRLGENKREPFAK
eukprot:2936909-Amphidinium_carterae.1